MKIEHVKRNLGKLVHCRQGAYGIDDNFLFKACILRKSKEGFYYTVELQDKNHNSLLYCRLEEIEEISEK